ncbi:MAG: 3-deoxy-D-manno-octulosonic acid transferase [Nitrospiraceae bacterium]|nr:3-deoxy-D-manno-octulosonic acid transferase [Nitrospiraceae bacterium]
MFFIYTILYGLALFPLFPVELRKRPVGQRAGWLREKFGLIEAAAGAVWVHAVSVGEVMAAVPFIEALNERGFKTLISTITDTGRKVAREKFPEADVVYLPFDLPFALKRAIKRAKPLAFVLVETELWPNAIRLMDKSGVPVFMVNGRLSEKSTKGYRKIGFFLERVFAHMKAVCVQDETYASRAEETGADRSRIKVTGNFKFEIKPKGVPPVWVSSLGFFPTIVAGSTHRGEDAPIIRAVKDLKGHFPSIRLVIAPRHPERASEVEETALAHGLSFIRSSELAKKDPSGKTVLPDIVIVDTVGELFHIYSAADVAVVGGSFIPHGGQNPLEPAYWGKAVVTGVHMNNFPFMDGLLKEGGALSVKEDALYETLLDLLSDERRRTEMGKKARGFYQKKGGAVTETVKILEGFLSK